MGSCCSKMRKRKREPFDRFHDSSRKSPTKLNTDFLSEPKILIIGAGVSGLSCAMELKRRGFEKVRIVDSSDRIGGRIRTMRFGDNYIDLGAQWVHGEKGNIVFQTVNGLDLLESSRDIFFRCEWIRSNGERMKRPLVDKLVNVMSNIFRNRHKDIGNYKGTFGEYLVEKFAEEVSKPKFQYLDHEVAAEFLRTFKKMEGAATDEDMCACNYEHYRPCEGDSFLNWRDKGYKQYLKQLVHGDEINDHGVLKGSIDLKTTVYKIEWDRSDGTVQVHCDSRTYIADHVVVTVSLGVLKNRVKLFEPCLPQAKRKAINFLGFGTVCKIFVEFEDAWWDEKWAGFNAMWRAGDLYQPQLEWISNIYAFHRYPYQPRVLLGWATGNYVELIESIDNKVLTQGILLTLRRFLPNQKIPCPKRLAVSRWSTDPAHMGVYSYPSMLTNCYHTGPHQLAQPVNILTYEPQVENHSWDRLSPMSIRPVLLFAGEATSAHHFSTVHGAVETGVREARRLSGYYQKEL